MYKLSFCISTPCQDGARGEEAGTAAQGEEAVTAARRGEDAATAAQLGSALGKAGLGAC